MTTAPLSTVGEKGWRGNIFTMLSNGFRGHVRIFRWFTLKMYEESMTSVFTKLLGILLGKSEIVVLMLNIFGRNQKKVR